MFKDRLILLLNSYDIMMECWQMDPSERPSFDDVYMQFDRILTVSDFVETVLIPLIHCASFSSF